MIIDDQEMVTEAVLQAMAEAPNVRLREIMAALVRHAHAFAREVRLSEDEFEQGVAFLNRIGQATNDAHNEGVLFSDAIGFSTLICLLNNGNAGAAETASALLGPFWRMHSPKTDNGASIVRSETPGPELLAQGRITDPGGQPISGVEVDVWQASPVGLYENQDETQTDMNLRGKFMTDRDGRFWFRSVRPAGYPVPTHGPVGDLLRAQRRSPFRPAHLHVLGFTRIQDAHHSGLRRRGRASGDRRGVRRHAASGWQIRSPRRRHAPRTRHTSALVHAEIRLRHGSGRSQAAGSSDKMSNDNKITYPKDLTGKVALIVGGAGAIGTSTGRMLASAGAPAHRTRAALWAAGYSDQYSRLYQARAARRPRCARRRLHRPHLPDQLARPPSFVPGRGVDFNATMAATTPLGRIGAVEDVAAAIAACATHLGYSTGHIIQVDGGRAL